MNDRSQTAPAHRPSRRNEIIDAAIVQFARKGFADTAISDVAEEAKVAVTAVYYHFSGKDEVYSAAVSRVFEQITAETESVRTGDTTPSLNTVIDAVWNWIDDHPDQAALLYSQLPGATPQATRLRQEFEEQHVQRAPGHYLSAASTGRSSKSRQAVETLISRTLVDLLISVHTMRLADGPLSDESNEKLRKSVHRLASRLVSA